MNNFGGEFFLFIYTLLGREHWARTLAWRGKSIESAVRRKFCHKPRGPPTLVSVPLASFHGWKCIEWAKNEGRIRPTASFRAIVHKTGQTLARNHCGGYEILATARKTDVAVSPVPGATCQRLPWWNFKSVLFAALSSRFQFSKKVQTFQHPWLKAQTIVCFNRMFDLRYRYLLWSMHYFGRSFHVYFGINFRARKRKIKGSRKILDDNEKRRNSLKKKNRVFVINEINFRRKVLLFLIQYEYKLFIREIRWDAANEIFN